MRLLNATELSDVELMAAVRAINSENLIRVLDFTTVTDERETPQAPGFIVELSGPLGTFQSLLWRANAQPMHATVQDLTHIVLPNASLRF